MHTFFIILNNLTTIFKEYFEIQNFCGTTYYNWTVHASYRSYTLVVLKDSHPGISMTVNVPDLLTVRFAWCAIAVTVTVRSRSF